MFLFTITKNEIAHNFDSVDIEESKKNKFIITSITDNFLSKRIVEKNGFSIIESPLISSSVYKNVIFSQVKYNDDNSMVNVFRSTLSGGPIYYYINSEGEFFCSSHIHLLRSAGVPIEENTEVLPEFFIYRYVMPPFTLYKNIFHLYSGGQLEIRLSEDKCKIQSLQHYDAPGPDQNIKSIRTSSKKTFDLITTSIERLSPRKNEIAVLLSGGIDSSIMCKICQNQFSIGTSYSTGYPFEDPAMNTEKNYALSAAQALGTTHEYYEPTIDEYLIGFLESIERAEEPLHHLQSISFHLLFKNCIPSNKKIVIMGQGAGFSYGNFRNYLYWKDKQITKIMKKKPMKYLLIPGSKASKNIKIFSNYLNESMLNYPLSHSDNPLWSWHDFGSKEWVCDYFHVPNKDIIEKRYNFIKGLGDKSIYDIWSLYSLLGDEDITQPVWAKIGEGDNRILYYPLYDANVLNYVFSIPWELKLKRPENILRKEIARRADLPDFIITRRKSAFGIKKRGWSEKEGIFEPLVKPASKVFDESQIRKMQSSNSKKAMTFWNILNYSLWKRLCLNNEPVEILLEELDSTM
jgi:asparagine synthetase B (glutamine-hydrolysing)